MWRGRVRRARQRSGHPGAPARDTAEPKVRQDAGVGPRVHAAGGVGGQDAAAVAHATTHQRGTPYPYAYPPRTLHYCLFP